MNVKQKLSYSPETRFLKYKEKYSYKFLKDYFNGLNNLLPL